MDQHRWTLRFLPGQDTSNIHLYLETFPLRDNCELIEQLLHNKQERLHREDQETENSPGAKETAQDWKNQ